MTEFIEALATNPILVASLFAALLASISSGVIGSYVVVKRIVFISGSISHSVLSGIGLSLWLERVQGVSWVSPLGGALVAALLSALLMGWIHLNYKEREDSVIAALWSIGMAIGVLFIAQTPGSNVELSNYLVGNILWVTPHDLKVLAILDVVILLVVLKYHKQFLALCFDENQARLQGINIPALYLLLLALTSITIVLLIQSSRSHLGDDHPDDSGRYRRPVNSAHFSHDDRSLLPLSPLLPAWELGGIRFRLADRGHDRPHFGPGLP